MPPHSQLARSHLRPACSALARGHFSASDHYPGIFKLPIELHQLILRHCDIPTLLLLIHDENLHTLAKEEIERWYISVLSTFCPDPAALRAMMRDTGSIITGTLAYRFIQRGAGPWGPDDICIVTTFRAYRKVKRFLKEMFPAARVTHWGVPSSIVQTPIVPYYNTATIEGKDLSIRVMQTRTQDIFYTLPFFDSTHLMNALTSDAFVCAYPDLTFHRKGIHTNHADYLTVRSRKQAHGQNEDCNIRVFQHANEASALAATCRTYAACAKVDRFLGDRWTLVLPIGLESVNEAASVLEGKEVTAWRIGGSACGNSYCFGSSSRSMIATRRWVGDRPTSNV